MINEKGTKEEEGGEEEKEIKLEAKESQEEEPRANFKFFFA